MKKFVCFILALVMVLMLASCGQTETTPTTTEDEIASTSIEIEDETNTDTEDADSAEDEEAIEEEDEDPDVDAESEDEDSDDEEAVETTESDETDDESDTDSETTATETSASFTVEEADETVYVHNTSSLNVRTGPGTEYKAIGSLSYGESVHQTGTCDNGWYQIEYDDETAYASGKYLSTDKPAATTSSSSSSSSSGSASSSTYPLTYSDSTCSITITKEKYAGSWCYIAHLKFTDYTRFGTACGNGTYGGYETTSHAAKRLGAVFCVNGDYCTPSYGAPVARHGVCYSSGGHEDIGYYSYYTGILASPASMGVSGTALQTLVDNGTVTDTFCFLHIAAGLVDGSVVHKDDSSRAQRTFIGTNGNPGDIYIVVSEGRYADGVSAGLTFDESMSLLQSKGCSFGLMLDGGGSSTMYFNGTVLNSASGSERSVVDFVYFK